MISSLDVAWVWLGHYCAHIGKNSINIQYNGHIHYYVQLCEPVRTYIYNAGYRLKSFVRDVGSNCIPLLIKRTNVTNVHANISRHLLCVLYHAGIRMRVRKTNVDPLNGQVCGRRIDQLSFPRTQTRRVTANALVIENCRQKLLVFHIQAAVYIATHTQLPYDMFNYTHKPATKTNYATHHRRRLFYGFHGMAKLHEPPAGP